MASVSFYNLIPGLRGVHRRTRGRKDIVIAVLDGPADLSCNGLSDASVHCLTTSFASGVPSNGFMTRHGTHVTSVIFGTENGPIQGIAPNCKGLLIPVYSDGEAGPTPQRDLARAIDMAIDAGAHILNISGGQLSENGEADLSLVRAIERANKSGALIVAAAGNDGCRCLHVPAALKRVLAVGAFGRDGKPMAFSNWGDVYGEQGILAPGESIPGLAPGSQVVHFTGTSFAAPLVTGVAALLCAIQAERGDPVNPQRVRRILLKTAHLSREAGDRRPYLRGSLNLEAAQKALAGVDFPINPSRFFSLGSVYPFQNGNEQHGLEPQQNLAAKFGYSAEMENSAFGDLPYRDDFVGKHFSVTQSGVKRWSSV